MTRSMRFKPPDIRGRSVLRPAAQEALVGRFDRPLTVVVAGAGFGKTTALVQMFEEHRLSPLGVDLWLACEPGDADAHSLTAALTRTFGLDGLTGPKNVIDSIMEAFGTLAPAEVCLVLDDVHHIAVEGAGEIEADVAGHDGATLLAELVERLPANAHVVLCGRTLPNIALSRMKAQGDCVVIGEEQLRFTGDQIADLARAVGAEESDFAGLAGWPALVALGIGRGRPTDFVHEEILDGLGTDERLLLEGLIAAGEADIALLQAVTGVDNEDALAGIPLVHRSGDRYVAHELWSDILGDDARVSDFRLQCARHLIEDHRFVEAVELCLRPTSRASDPTWAAVLDDALVGALGGLMLPDGPTMKRWSSALSTDERDRAPGLLLRGLVERLDRPADAHCQETLERAATLFRHSGNIRGEAGAVSALTYSFHVRRDVSGLRETYTRLIELADAGSEEGIRQRQLAMAVVATATGQFEDVEGYVRPLLDDTAASAARGVALWLKLNALNSLGESTIDIANEVAAADVSLPGLAVAKLSARVRTGEIRLILDDPPLEPTDERDRYLHAVWMTFAAAVTGDVETAQRYLDRVRSAGPSGSEHLGDGSDVTPAVGLAIERDEHADAAALLREMIAQHPIDGPSRGVYAMSVGMAYLLLPEHRDYFDGLQLGPLFRRDRALSRALAALVERNDSTVASSIELPERAEQMLPSLGLNGTARLLAALWSLDHPAAPGLVADLVEFLAEPSRDAFRRATTHVNKLISSGAKGIVSTIPFAPAHTMQLRLLGSTELSIDGRLVDNPNWRRERVRALLAYLAMHKQATRESVIGALWPDADSESGRRNLRSTLNRLNAVLEPDRSPGDAPFHIRSTGQVLRFVRSDTLHVDVDGLESALNEAERLEAARTPSLAIEPYARSTKWYRGDLLPDCYDDWVLMARDRLRSRYVTGAVRCAELLVATGRFREATDVISAVLHIEPWSESAHRTLVAAHLAAGDVAAARRAMATCETVLAEIGGLGDESTLMLRRRLELRE